MRRAISIWVASIFIGAMMASSAMAQRPRRIGDLDHFLQNHPQVAKRLAADPNLADNPEFLAKHPALKKFLITHPGAREQLQSASQRYVVSPPDAKAGGPAH